MKNINEIAGTTFIAIFAIVSILCVLFLPFIAIWAINTLFGTMIPYTIWTWLAAFVLMGLTSVSVMIRS